MTVSFPESVFDGYCQTWVFTYDNYGGVLIYECG